MKTLYLVDLKENAIIEVLSEDEIDSFDIHVFQFYGWREIFGRTKITESERYEAYLNPEMHTRSLHETLSSAVQHLGKHLINRGESCTKNLELINTALSDLSKLEVGV